ncbi:asparagine synthase (glutamine-hydrolyzing) [Nonomuraea sp. SBT364]|uniref:asparagine synthase (glutamine-hydrolyzing) n=1 Tax=Nonomuraea sp. SBT364 TaxID=1580530 RepID=UPI0018CE16F1|nr:asparagine synthase (glutamine-hydrolyzing) [Nonomuraea sp. SBT364]
MAVIGEGVAGGSAPLVTEMTRTLAHRGPDDSGTHLSGDVGLGSRRLSVIDVERGRQPIESADGRLRLVANGEIYNHRELRESLRARGHTFATGSDSEVILHLYEEYGDRCAEHLRGMYAFAIADGDRVLLARDPLGIKPLYHARLPTGELLFASEIKALLRAPGLDAGLDPQAFADTLVLGHPAGDHTYFRHIRSVPPGHTMTVSAAGPGTPLPFGGGEEAAAAPASFDEAVDLLIGRLRHAVRSHLVADVEVGLTLSGGLDSAVLATLMRRERGGPFRVYSVADSDGHPDLVQARGLAASMGLPHRVSVLDFDTYLETVPAYLWSAEAPIGLGGLPLYHLAGLIAHDLKVCLNGEGADELFGGYAEYLDRGTRARYVAAQLPKLRRLAALPSPRAREILDGLSGEHPFSGYLERVLADNMRDQLVRLHLEPLDKSSMAAGLEMRVPFMDDSLVRFVTSLPAAYKVDARFGFQKHLLRRAALRLCGGDGPLADSVLRRKIGAPSSGMRLRGRLERLCERSLPAGYREKHEFGFCFDSNLELLVFDLFTEIFVTGRGAYPHGLSLLDFVAERAGRPVASLVTADAG